MIHTDIYKSVASNECTKISRNKKCWFKNNYIHLICINWAYKIFGLLIDIFGMSTCESALFNGCTREHKRISLLNSCYQKDIQWASSLKWKRTSEYSFAEPNIMDRAREAWKMGFLAVFRHIIKLSPIQMCRILNFNVSDVILSLPLLIKIYFGWLYLALNKVIRVSEFPS